MPLCTLASRSRFKRLFRRLVPSLRVYIVLNIYIFQFSYVYSVCELLQSVSTNLFRDKNE